MADKTSTNTDLEKRIEAMSAELQKATDDSLKECGRFLTGLNCGEPIYIETQKMHQLIKDGKEWNSDPYRFFGAYGGHVLINQDSRLVVALTHEARIWYSLADLPEEYWQDLSSADTVFEKRLYLQPTSSNGADITILHFVPEFEVSSDWLSINRITDFGCLKPDSRAGSYQQKPQ